MPGLSQYRRREALRLVGRYTSTRRGAATRIQRAWKRRRGRVAQRQFTGRVQSAIRRGEPQQYYVTNLLNQTAVTQAPEVYSISNLYYDNTVNAVNNPKWHRSSNRIFVQNMHLNIRVTAQKDNFNTVCVALVRHKRSEPITQTMIQRQQLLPVPATVPEMTAVDRPFLNIMSGYNPAGSIPPVCDLNFGKPTTNANVDALASFFNPKVVDLMWHKTVKVQPLYAEAPATGANIAFPTGWPYIRDFEYNKKFNETWKYPSSPAGTTGYNTFPTVNNKCYSLIVWSDSIAVPGGSHPIMDVSMRMSFKDID